MIGTAGFSGLGGGGGSEDSCPLAGTATAASSIAATIIVPNLNIRMLQEQNAKREVNRALNADGSEDNDRRLAPRFEARRHMGAVV